MKKEPDPFAFIKEELGVGVIAEITVGFRNLDREVLLLGGYRLLHRPA